MRPVFLCILFCALSQGCDQPSATQATATKPRVVATTTMIGDLVRQIGGEDVALTVIMPAGHRWCAASTARGDRSAP
ncbi:MAG TPA: hypothetical protein PLD59_13965, partial [Tepidisphaeraceae bacterium]|nr:hypothetical protein [Tepidisphaeraceae bacterium]